MSRRFLLFTIAAIALAGSMAAQTPTPAKPRAETAKRTPPRVPVQFKGLKGKTTVQPLSSIDLACEGGKKITIATGSNTGTCYTQTNASGTQVAAACNDGPNQVWATCAGCQETKGTASCTVK